MVLPSIRPAVQDLDYRPGQLAIGRRQVRALWSEISLGAIHSLTGGLGADVTIDAVGVPATFELDGQAKLGVLRYHPDGRPSRWRTVPESTLS